MLPKKKRATKGGCEIRLPDVIGGCERRGSLWTPNDPEGLACAAVLHGT